MTQTNRFANLLGWKGQEEETPVIPLKPKEQQVAEVSGEKKKETPKFEFDWSKPYGGVVDKYYGKPQLDSEGIKRNNRTIKTQGIADMLRLVGEAVTGSMGGDIIKRGANKVSAQAAADNQRLMDIFRTEKARYNSLKLQEALRNMDYGIRRQQREEDREWQNEMFDKRTAASEKIWDKHYKIQRADKEADAESQRKHQVDILKQKHDWDVEDSKADFNRRVALLNKRQSASGGTSSKPYIQILGADGVPVNLNQGQYYNILNKIARDPETRKTIDGLITASDNLSKNRLGMLVQEYANQFFDARNGVLYPKGSIGKNSNTGGL